MLQGLVAFSIDVSKDAVGTRRDEWNQITAELDQELAALRKKRFQHCSFFYVFLHLTKVSIIDSNTFCHGHGGKGIFT